MATSIEDVLARRLGLQLFDWDMAIQAAPAVAEILATELNWTTAAKQENLRTYVTKIKGLQENIGIAQAMGMRGPHE
jgi:glycerol-3-phosphate dehydrogenase